MSPEAPPYTLHRDWIIPSWPALAHVHAVCTTRAGGASAVPFESMNLGDQVGDDAQRVAQNRALLRQAIRVEPVFLNQVHGIKVVEHGPGMAAAAHPPIEADACITRHKGVACTIMVADCLPVLITNRQGSRVGAAHAGWRGLAGVEKFGVLEAICQQFGTSAAAPDILVWLGPCIGPLRFEVGDDVRDVFLTLNERDSQGPKVVQDVQAHALFQPHGPGKWLANLAGLARLRLRAAGIQHVYGNDGSPAWCTASNPSRFFSHRRDARALGGSGRMAASIWLS